MASSTSLRDALTRAAERLGRAGVPDPIVDAELLAAHVLGLGRGEVQAAALRGDELSGEAVTALGAVIERRAAREPLQHITGTAPFRHLELRVGPGVFVPRPETEIVAQFAIDALRAAASPRPIAVDLGTGSGAIAIAIASERPQCELIAIDRSATALEVAVRNAARLNVPNVKFSHGDWFAPLQGERVDVIVSNPPYIAANDPDLDAQVLRHEPYAALIAGRTGLEAIEHIAASAPRHLAPGGWLLIEHGWKQAQAVRDLLVRHGFTHVRSHRDLAGHERVTEGRR